MYGKAFLESVNFHTCDYMQIFNFRDGHVTTFRQLQGLVTLVSHNDLEGISNFSSTIYSFSILCLEHHYCGD